MSPSSIKSDICRAGTIRERAVRAEAHAAVDGRGDAAGISICQGLLLGDLLLQRHISRGVEKAAMR